MSKINDGGPAYPGSYTTTDFYGRETIHVRNGMSLRDWFAGQIAAADVAASTNSRPSPDDTAKYAYELADAMLVAREKGDDA